MDEKDGDGFINNDDKTTGTKNPELISICPAAETRTTPRLRQNPEDLRHGQKLAPHPPRPSP
jgi:hypothetical protein